MQPIGADTAQAITEESTAGSRTDRRTFEALCDARHRRTRTALVHGARDSEDHRRLTDTDATVSDATGPLGLATK